MSTECKNHIDVLSTLEYHDRRAETVAGIDLSKPASPILESIAKELAKISRDPDFKYNQSHIKKAIKKLYGTVDERMLLATQLLSILENNPGLERQIKDFLYQQITRSKAKDIDYDLETDYLDPMTVPVNILRNAINESKGILKHVYGENIAKGILGKINLQFTIPRKMARKESTGAIYDMYKAVVDFPRDQANHLQRFMRADPFEEQHVTLPDPNKINPTTGEPLINPKTGKPYMITKVRDYGIADIMESIQNLASHESLNDIDVSNVEKEVVLTTMFARYNTKDDFGNRSLRIDENGNATAATGWEDSGKKYKKTGDPIYAFTNYKPYKELAKERFVPFDKNGDMLKTFLTETERYKELHKNVWDFFKAEFKVLERDLYREIRHLFPDIGWTDKDITDLFFKEHPSESKLWDTLSPERQQLVEHIHQNATRYNVLKPFIFNAKHEGEGDKGRDSFPIIYESLYFSYQWDEMISKYEALLEDVESDLTNPELDPLLKHALMMKKKQYQSILKRSYRIRNNKDDYPVDMSTGTYLALGTDSKHVEHISNAFNVLEGRTDKAAYNQYLQHNISGLERNRLSITFIQSLKKAKSEPVRDYITNLYKVALYQPDAASGFLWLKWDSASVSKMLGKAGITISASKIDRKMRQVLSFISGNLLRGQATAVQNSTAIIQKFIDVGFNRTMEAIRIWKIRGPEIEKLLNLSGVVDFREFFSLSLTNEANNLGAQRKHVMGMTAAMIKYWKAAGKTKSEKTLEALKKKLEKEIGKTLKTIPKLERLEQRSKVEKDYHRNQILRKWVDYAINKEYEAAPYVKNIKIKRGMQVAEMIAQFEQEYLPTMGKTEQMVRGISFIIGIKAAMDKGFIPNKSFDKLTKEDFQQAIYIGRNYVEMMDFGMSRQDIGQIGQSSIGRFFTLFKVWSFQKFAKDLDTVRLAYQELADVESKYIDVSATLKMFESLFRTRKYSNKKLRATSPSLASFRTWLYTQGLWTAIWDFAIMGPLLLVPGVKKMTRRIPVMRTIGGATSDLVSLMLLIPGLAVAISSGEGEDEWEKIVDYYSRRTIFGFGGRWAMDWVLGMLAFMEDEDEKELANRINRIISPTLPPVIKESKVTYDLLKEILD